MPMAGALNQSLLITNSLLFITMRPIDGIRGFSLAHNKAIDQTR